MAAQKTLLTDTSLLKAIDEMERGLVDADLGGSVYKKRVVLPGRCKSGSARTLIATNRQDHWIFLFEFEKNDKENITQAELAYLQEVGQIFLDFSDDELQLGLSRGNFLEVYHDEA